MVFNEIIYLIEKNSQVMAATWAKEMKEAPFCKTYHKLLDDQLINLGKNVYDNLGKWLDKDTPRIEIGRIYSAIGYERYYQGYPLCEIIYATHLTKKVLADFINSKGTLPTAMDLYNSMDFFDRLYDFYDIAVFYLVRGYQEAIFKEFSKIKGLNADDIKKVFPIGSFFNDQDRFSHSFEKLMAGFNLFKTK